MSERSLINDMLSQIRNHQVEASPEVMELAIARANKKRKLRLIMRWSSLLFVAAGLLLGLNWNSDKEEPVLPTAPIVAPVKVVPIEPKIQKESESISGPAVALPAKPATSKNESTTTNAYHIESPIVEDPNHSSVSVSSQVLETERVVDSSDVAPKIEPVKVDEQQSKKTKPKGKRKLKLIIPQP
jgi:hypothetical protein